MTESVGLMVVAPHPDDPEFGVAGTVARWVREGKKVVYELCTSGDTGTSDTSMPPADMAQIREAEQLRFRSIMVDEFQDTNRLQTELIDLLCAGVPKELFFVGDEFQSIYGFRHADVAVFRDRREAAPQVLPLTLNYRSRPEVLAAVNELFADGFGDSFQPLQPAAGYGDPVFGTPFELLVTDKASYADSGVHWRADGAKAAGRRRSETQQRRLLSQSWLDYSQIIRRVQQVCDGVGTSAKPP